MTPNRLSVAHERAERLLEDAFGRDALERIRMAQALDAEAVYDGGFYTPQGEPCAVCGGTGCRCTCGTEL